MRRTLVQRGLVLAAAALLGLAGCRTARMDLPAELAGLSALPVEGRQGWKFNEKIRFGDFEAQDVDRSWTRGSDFRILTYSSSKRRQSYEFTLMERGSPRVNARCEAAFRARGAEVRGVEIVGTDRSALECSIRLADDPQDVWALRLAEEREQPMKGSLRGTGASYEVVGTNRVAGGLLPVEDASGYRFRQGGRALAAVDVLGDGAVYLGSGEPRVVLAAAAAALLLHENLREVVERGGD